MLILNILVKKIVIEGKEYVVEYMPIKRLHKDSKSIQPFNIKLNNSNHESYIFLDEDINQIEHNHFTIMIQCSIDNILRKYFIYYMSDTNTLYIHSSAIGVSIMIKEKPKLFLNLKEEKEQSDGTYKSPMAGKVVSTNVNIGDQVDVGDALIVIESMKIDHMIRSLFKGTVKEVYVTPGQVVAQGEILISIDKPTSKDEKFFSLNS